MTSAEVAAKSKASVRTLLAVDIKLIGARAEDCRVAVSRRQHSSYTRTLTDRGASQDYVTLSFSNLGSDGRDPTNAFIDRNGNQRAVG